MRRIAVYGATGSVGSQALDVVRHFPDELSVALLSCRRQTRLLAEAANEFRPQRLVVAADDADVGVLADLLDYAPEIFVGQDGLVSSLEGLAADVVLNAVAGISGLPLLAAALRAGVPTALSNKESVVAGADLIRRLWQETGTPIYPVDSEHAAVYECLGDTFNSEAAATIWLTASGGPFLHTPAPEMARATVAQALAHPNWDMGPKISVDSATMANKGLEVIEAHYLFAMPAERIRVVIQPASLVHSMVEFRDTTVLAQLGLPDMRVPIERALLGPEAAAHPLGGILDFWKVGSLEFMRPDFEKFPCLGLAYEALAAGETAVYNAADDGAVGHFLRGQIALGQIPQIIRRALAEFRGARPDSIEAIMELDRSVHKFVDGLCN